MITIELTNDEAVNLYALLDLVDGGYVSEEVSNLIDKLQTLIHEKINK